MMFAGRNIGKRREMQTSAPESRGLDIFADASRLSTMSRHKLAESPGLHIFADCRIRHVNRLHPPG